MSILLLLHTNVNTPWVAQVHMPILTMAVGNGCKPVPVLFVQNALAVLVSEQFSDNTNLTILFTRFNILTGRFASVTMIYTYF